MLFEEWLKQIKDLLAKLKPTLLESGVNEDEASDLVATVNEETAEMLRDIGDAVLSARFLTETTEPEDEEEEEEATE